MMAWLDSVIGKVVGLFVDDDFLACSILVVVGITAMVLRGTPMNAIVAAVVLAGGCLAVLVVGVLRTARSREPR
jgi:CBS-domain-containing membrane protein